MKVLVLTHRLPFAPNRGDRVRAYHIIRLLAARADVHVVSLGEKMVGIIHPCKIYGAMAVARFNQNGNGPFLAPTFNTSGGGNSTMQFDSDAVRKALNVAGPTVLGVHEY